MSEKIEVREIAMIVVDLATVAVTVWVVWRALSSADSGRALRMRLYATAEQFSQRQAEHWAHAADKARTMYDRARTVTV